MPVDCRVLVAHPPGLQACWHLTHDDDSDDGACDAEDDDDTSLGDEVS